MKDTFRHKGLRKKLVEELREKGITDEPVLEAIRTIPRHFFMDTTFDEWAYEDKAMPIESGQTISQPYTVAIQSSLLKVENRNKILEIGTGSGYQTAILGFLGARVFSVENHKLLHKQSVQFFEEHDYGNIRLYFRDGHLGLAEYAPYDRILITAAVSEIPSILIDQLKEGGIMVLPLGQKKQIMTRLTKGKDGKITKETFGNFRFVPFTKGVFTD